MQNLDTSSWSKEHAERLFEKSMELYGSPYHRIPESHQGRVRSEVDREEALLIEDATTAFERGLRSGRADFSIGIRLNVNWFSSPHHPNEYVREYTRGYRAGWVQAQRKFAE